MQSGQLTLEMNYATQFELHTKTVISFHPM